MNERFVRLANLASSCTGSASAFVVAVVLTLVWAGCGPIFHYSDTWQLVINTGTGIVTFLMVFLIQNAQNRDTKAMRRELHALFEAHGEARRSPVDLSRLDRRELESLRAEIDRLLDGSNGSAPETREGAASLG